MSSVGRNLILIVDDTPTNVAVISGLLKETYKTKVATNGEKTLAIANGADKPDLILKQVPQGFHQFEAKLFGQTADIVVRLDHMRLAPFDAC